MARGCDENGERIASSMLTGAMRGRRFFVPLDGEEETSKLRLQAENVMRRSRQLIWKPEYFTIEIEAARKFGQPK